VTVYILVYIYIYIIMHIETHILVGICYIQTEPVAVSLGIKRPEREADHSLPSSGAEAKNDGAPPYVFLA
jgi:hypothetical protein